MMGRNALHDRPIAPYSRLNYRIHTIKVKFGPVLYLSRVSITHYRIRVHGRVQGVGYRQFALEQARISGLAATAQNLPDGSVEVHAEGEVEDMRRFLTAAKRGPLLAQVAHVQHTELPVEGLKGTHVIR